MAFKLAYQFYDGKRYKIFVKEFMPRWKTYRIKAKIYGVCRFIDGGIQRIYL